MAKIIKVNGMTNKGDHAIVEVVTDSGDVGEIFIGGSCQVYFHKGKIKIFINKGVNK